MMKFAAGIRCPNRNCNHVYDAMVESGYHAECPECGQVNRVAGQSMSDEISGCCKACGRPLDDLHIYGRTGFVCPPDSAFKRSF